MALNDRARELDEGVRFPLCDPTQLVELWRAAGLQAVDAAALDVVTRVRDFGDLWSPWNSRRPIVVEHHMPVLSPSAVPSARTIIVIVALVTMAACGSGVASSLRQAPTPTTTPPAFEDATAAAPPLTLYVSNQSFEDATVWITVSIDGVVVVDQDVAVKDQHHWIMFALSVAPGEHTLTASSDTGAELSVEFTTRAGEPRWAVVDYWWYPGDVPRSFTFDIRDEPISFA